MNRPIDAILRVNEITEVMDESYEYFDLTERKYFEIYSAPFQSLKNEALVAIQVLIT